MKDKRITSTEIIRIRDKMTISQLRKINEDCLKKYGFIDYRHLFMTMGYVHAYNNVYHKP